MDEQRLKEIEAKFPPTVFGAWAVIRELIAALRYEWAKRNKYIEETFANLGESEKQTEQQRKRAERAEAEVAKYHSLFSQQSGAGRSFVEIINNLVAVREAAESVRPLLTRILRDRYPDRDLEACVGTIWDALDACKGG